MPADLASGRWFDVATEAQHDNLRRHGTPTPGHHSARIQRGAWAGPGRYMLLTYSQRCPRNCCDDLVFEVLSAAEVAGQVRDVIRLYADILREARRPPRATAAE